jgi:predicted CXXCH cytochrome family protein
MRNFYGKNLFLTFICSVFMVIGATDTFAYETFKDGCKDCHDKNHSLHKALANDDCSRCHVKKGDNPLTGLNDTEDRGCVGCHGRIEDGGNDDTYPGLGAGLRQHHWIEGETVCADCHSDADPSNYTTVGEDISPLFYPELGLYPCNDSLDNDGDDTNDGTDSDCIQAADTDNDGVENDLDNCPENPNPGQEDADNDGIGDVCDDPADGEIDIDLDIDLDDYNLSIWDFSGSYTESQENRTLTYTLIQDSKGKVTGSGIFDDSSDEKNISIDVEIKGNVKGKNNIVTLKYKVKGKDAEGNKIQDDLKLELDESILSLVGTEKMKICQKGAGCEKTEEGVSLDVPDGMTGEAVVSIDATPDENGKKLEGTAELTLSNDDEYPLYAKGKYNSNKDETQFQLKGVDEPAKGIKIKLKIVEESDAVTFINGKALGQQLKYKLE